jgi:CDP-glucose 4,6-dehydratase
MNTSFWNGKKVLVTGHTGFKGSWLCLMLQLAGARVSGYALAPPTEPSLFEIAKIDEFLFCNYISDVRDADRLSAAMQADEPEIVFHLAAQSLVRYSYAKPLETFDVNVMGTATLLEVARNYSSVKTVVNVTTDKCYENREWEWAYREYEPLGGRDPYSASKACAEIVSAAYRDSFLAKSGKSLATVRAGNVIGGGDWATDRLLPDFFRSVERNEVLKIRSPDAIRPWQHILEPLSGYVRLAELMYQNAGKFSSAWNFGPSDDDAKSVSWILDYLSARIDGAAWEIEGGEKVHEAQYLKLDSSRARQYLGWVPKWNLPRALEMTYVWMESWRAGKDMKQVCVNQIRQHLAENGS